MINGNLYAEVEAEAEEGIVDAETRAEEILWEWLENNSPVHDYEIYHADNVDKLDIKLK